MNTIILDTNIVSELMKPDANLVIKRWLDGLDDTVLVRTLMTVAEISYRLERLPVGERRSKLERSFMALVGAAGPLPVLPLDEITARAAGNMRAYREANDIAATFADTSIAGIALVTRVTLATRNVKDFAGLGIDLVNPWVEGQEFHQSCRVRSFLNAPPSGMNSPLRVYDEAVHS